MPQLLEKGEQAFPGDGELALVVPEPDAGAEERVQEWEQTNAASITRAKTAIAELEGAGDLAALSVLLRQIRTLVRTSAAA